ncbi:gamma-glutamyl kinase [Roseovarius sp. S1116L3]|uniref:gamma-glutamyl kinase n=1 Tax=Roseovarius roseus TaxID=3342636 RepID=UPI00372711E0
MLVFSKQKLVFLSVPKTGTTAWQAALGPHASMIVSDPPELKHAPIFRYNRFFRPALEKFIGEDLHVIAVMRAPIDWLGSWYRYRQRPFLAGQPTSTEGLSFDAFVRAYVQGNHPQFANVGSQSKFLEPQRNGTSATHLFRYEEQDALLAYLEQRLGIRVQPDRLNTSRLNPLHLSSETKAILERKYAPDFRLYNSIQQDGTYTPEPDASPVG